MTERLTSGWEPDLPASDSLLRRYVMTTVEVAAHAARSAAGRVEQWDEAAAADARSPFLFDNLAVLMQPPSSAGLDVTIRRLLGFYPPHRHFALLSPFPTPDLSGHGLQLMGYPPLMYRPVGGTPPAVPPGLEIAAVTDAARLKQFVDTLVEGYPVPEAADTAIAGAAFLDGPVRLFLGLVDGEPVGTAGARVAHGLVDVEWVSTLPEHRGKGYGAALAWAATLAEPRWPAVLIASDDGQAVYDAMGYERLLRLTMWHRPPVE